MAGSKSALIISSSIYTDPGLRRLHAPASDATALAAVLRDAAIGGFEVNTSLNEPAHRVNLAVEEFFADRQADDLLLLHFSFHGVKDENGEAPVEIAVAPSSVTDPAPVPEVRSAASGTPLDALAERPVIMGADFVFLAIMLGLAAFDLLTRSTAVQPWWFIFIFGIVGIAYSSFRRGRMLSGQLLLSWNLVWLLAFSLSVLATHAYAGATYNFALVMAEYYLSAIVNGVLGGYALYTSRYSLGIFAGTLTAALILVIMGFHARGIYVSGPAPSWAPAGWTTAAAAAIALVVRRPLYGSRHWWPDLHKRYLSRR